MSIIDDVKAYEDWLARQCDIVKTGLDEKHERMAHDPLKFFRATCFRFARKLFDWLPEFEGGPLMMSVGDAHTENWGTWRDAEGRLVWGVNDFDEAAMLPYTCDLIRLATSARLVSNLQGDNEARAASIIQGYRRGLAAPAPFFIDDQVPWMQAMVNRPAAKIDAFRIELSKAAVAVPPSSVSALLAEQLPAGTREIEFRAWQRGGGSLGRPRFLAIGTWDGGRVVREAKALVPSSWEWASGKASAVGLFQLVATGRYRSPDPFLKVRSNFVVRRIAADSQKIDLGEEDAREYGADLLAAMGADLAAIHLAGNVSADDIRSDLDGRKPEWLHNAAKTVEEFVTSDFVRWKGFQCSEPD
jgi:hypothetical protein